MQSEGAGGFGFVIGINEIIVGVVVLVVVLIGLWKLAQFFWAAS